MATWFWELRQINQGIFHRLEQLGECPRKIVGIQGILQKLFGEMNKLNSEAKKYARKNSKDGSIVATGPSKTVFCEKWNFEATCVTRV